MDPFVQQLEETGRAVLLTVNGHAELAVMSAATFQTVLEAMDMLDSVKGIRAGITDMKAGRSRPASEFFPLPRSRTMYERPRWNGAGRHECKGPVIPSW